MKSLAFVLAVFVEVIVGLKNLDLLDFTNVYSIWKPKFHKYYANKSEELQAANLIQFEYEKIKEFNKRFENKTASFHRKLWKHSDCTETERKQLTSGFRYDDTESTRRQKRETINYPEAPASFDWRNFSVMTPVQDQSYECSSCYAFATTGAIEALFARHYGKLVKLSEQQILDCNFNDSSGNWGCDGGWMAPAFAYIAGNRGIVKATSYPYEGAKHACRYNSSNSVGSITSFVRLTSSDEENLKKALAAVGPIATAIDASLDTFFSYADGIYYDKACSKVLTHAVLLVGYGSDPLFGDFWICKNTWSTSWGEEGYFRIKRNANNHCGIGLYAVYPVL